MVTDSLHSMDVLTEHVNRRTQSFMGKLMVSGVDLPTNPLKSSPLNHHFPMVFPWFYHGLPRVFPVFSAPFRVWQNFTEPLVHRPKYGDFVRAPQQLERGQQQLGRGAGHWGQPKIWLIMVDNG